MSGRHVQGRGATRPGHSSAAASGAPSGRTISSFQMPKYEPPKNPLTLEAQQKLRALAQTHSNRKYEHHLSRVAKLISEHVTPMGDILEENRKSLQHHKQKRIEMGRQTDPPQQLPKSQVEILLGERVASQEPLIEENILALEKALRTIIDYKTELDHEKDALRQAVVDATERADKATAGQERLKRARERKEAEERAGGGTQNKMRNSGLADDESDDEEESDSDDGYEEDPVQLEVTAIDSFCRTRDNKKIEYGRGSEYRKYGSHNDYIGFRQLVHDTQHPEGGSNLPHAKHWFGEDGEPRGMLASKEGDDGDDSSSRDKMDVDSEDSDADLVVEAVQRSFRCPLSMKVMEDPVKSKLCPHTYEKSALKAYLESQGGRAVCPQSGCEKVLTMTTVEEDVVLRAQIRRSLKRRDSDDEVDDDAEELSD